MSALEALLAVMIFVLTISFFVYGLSTIIDDRILSMNRLRLKEKSRLISEFIALYLETNPQIFEEERSTVISKLEEEVRKYNYEHKLLLGPELQLIQTRVKISFPNILVKEENKLKVFPDRPFYVITIDEYSGEAHITRASGIHTTHSGDRLIIATAGAIYTVGYLRTEINFLTSTDLPCHVVYFLRENICVGTLKVKSGDTTVIFESSCVPTTEKSLVIQRAERVKDSIDHLLAKGVITPPYGIVCGGKYYVYPPLDEPLVLFRADVVKVPKSTVFESYYSLALIDGFVVLIETVVWE